MVSQLSNMFYHAEQGSLLCKNNRSKNKPRLTFHTFPKENAVNKQWLIQIRRYIGRNVTESSDRAKRSFSVLAYVLHGVSLSDSLLLQQKFVLRIFCHLKL